MPRVQDGENECQEVGRCSEQKCLHAGEAECLHDRGEEVGEAHRYDGACLDENKERLEMVSKVSNTYEDKNSRYRVTASTVVFREENMRQRRYVPLSGRRTPA